ncbi:MAG: sigma-70 family RNA polymerase sigma factor [Sphaerochaeta sp.]|nr:sigma-70 family RNA polymerase sigma factor [Sphaerochaeta sp.]
MNTALTSKNEVKIKQAYEVIYNEYVKLVSFCVAKYVSDKDTIKEITNDVFVSFFNHSSKVDGNLKSYLCQMAKNASLNYLNKEKRLVYIDNCDEIASQEAYPSAPFYSSLVNDLSEVLSKDEVEIILLHAVEGYSFKEIGQRKNISSNNANVIYFRAIKRFKKSSKGMAYGKE